MRQLPNCGTLYPRNIRNPNCLANFRGRVKSYLFQIAYQVLFRLVICSRCEALWSTSGLIRVLYKFGFIIIGIVIFGIIIIIIGIVIIGIIIGIIIGVIGIIIMIGIIIIIMVLL